MLLENNLSAAAGDHTERQGFFHPAFSSPASPVVSKALNSGDCGGGAPAFTRMCGFLCDLYPFPMTLTLLKQCVVSRLPPDHDILGRLA